MASNPASHGKQAVTAAGRSTDSVSVAPDELLELLGDNYTREVLEAVMAMPRSGREVSEVTSVSKPTAFRRLNRLEEAGLVRTELAVDKSGHHHKEYRAVIEELTVEFGSDGITIDLEVDQSGEELFPPKTIADD